MSEKGVIANSFPKSGTHVLTQLLSLLGYQESNTHLSRSLLVYGPRNIFRNAQIYHRLSKKRNVGINVDIENPSKKINPKWFQSHIDKKLIKDRYCQAHLPFSLDLEELVGSLKVPMLYIYRNPLDALVSLKNYILKKKNHPNHYHLVDCSTDYDRYLFLINGYNDENNRTMMAPFFEKYKHSIAWASSDNVCSLKFEDIIGEQGGGNSVVQKQTLEKVLKYLGKEIQNIDQIQTQIYNPNSATFHKGKIGLWKNDLPLDILEICKQKMKEASLDFYEHCYSQ